VFFFFFLEPRIALGCDSLGEVFAYGELKSWLMYIDISMCMYFGLCSQEASFHAGEAHTCAWKSKAKVR